MAKTGKDTRPPLTAAAEAFDAEFKRFEALSEAALRGGLNSQKALERASDTLREVADSDERLGAALKGLVEAITHVRERQQAHAEAVRLRANELQERTGVFKDLLARYETLGQAAAKLNELVQKVAGAPEPGQPEPTHAQRLEGLAGLNTEMDHVAQEAEGLAQASEERDFADLARQADGLRQQLLSVKNRLNLLLKSA